MSVTPRRALLVIDVQNEYVTGNLPIEYPDIRSSLANIGCAMDAAQHAGLVVEFLVDAAGSLSYENHAGRASAEEIHRVFTVVMQSRFAAVATTEEWIAALQTGEALSRDNIHASNRRARGLAKFA